MESVEGQIKNTQTALRDVNRLLKLDPTNTELLAQKHSLLKEAINETKEKLESLKKIEKQAKAQFESGDLGKDKYEAIRREIIETENQLENLKKTAGSASEKMASLSAKMADFGSKAESAANKIAPLSKAAGTLATAAIATVPATEELRTDLSKLDQNARESGAGIDAAREAFSKFNVVSDETDSSVEATSNLLQAGFTESNLQKAVEGLSGAYLRFPDTLKIESLADSLQETLATGTATGQFGELLDRLGIGAENFSEKLASCATDAEKQNLALQTLADAGLMDSYEGWKENNKELVESKEASQEFQEATAELATTLQPILTKITEGITLLIRKFNGLSPEAQKMIMVIVGIVAAAAPLLSTVGKVSLGISKITESFSKLSGAGGMIAKFGKGVKTVLGGIGTVAKGLFSVISGHPIITVITAIVAIIIVLYNKCEWFRDGVNAIIETVVGFFQNFGEKAKESFEKVRMIIESAVLTITTTFQNMSDSASEIWENIKNKVVGVVTGLSEKAISAFNGMVGGIKSTLSKITGVVSDGFNGAIEFITGLPKKALKWGSDFVDGMIKGIKNAAGKLWDAAEDLADGIASFLHFSRPDEGPLHEYETWMPDFVDGLTRGIKENEYKISNAVKSMAGKMADGTINMNSMVTAGAMPINLESNTVVQIGNESLDGYITKTAVKGINKNRLNSKAMKGR